MRRQTAVTAILLVVAVTVAAIVAVVALLLAPADDPPPEPGAGGQADRWTPTQGVRWQWQLSGTPTIEPGVDVYGMDGHETSETTVREFRNQGKRTICYLSAGTVETWRPDSHRFPEEVVGKPMEEWKDEYWLDVRQLEALLPIMAARMDECAGKGFDAVEPDNVDGFINDTGFPLSPEDQLRYNRAVARLAHERGLAVALKNDVDQIAELEPNFDFAINEECFAYDECEAYEPFTATGKVVFNVEYADVRDLCARAQELGLTSTRKDMELGAWREGC